MEDKPNSGSEEAQEQGCISPIRDILEQYGEGVYSFAPDYYPNIKKPMLSLEQASDELCNTCNAASVNSSDGGRLPCGYHKLKYINITYPVIYTENLYGGDWTHTWVDKARIKQLLVAIIEDYQEGENPMSPDDYVDRLGVDIIQMTKEDFEKVPEL